VCVCVCVCVCGWMGVWQFGTVVADSSMFYHGLYMELIGTLISFVVGLLTGGVGAAWADQLGWPTNEMSSRGQWSSLLIGLVFAVPSGAGASPTLPQNPAVGGGRRPRVLLDVAGGTHTPRCGSERGAFRPWSACERAGASTWFAQRPQRFAQSSIR
jgi:hypothetical protein